MTRAKRGLAGRPLALFQPDFTAISSRVGGLSSQAGHQRGIGDVFSEQGARHGLQRGRQARQGAQTAHQGGSQGAPAVGGVSRGRLLAELVTAEQQQDGY